MKAKLVSENIYFERGIDPKAAMGIGDKEFQMNKRIKKEIKEWGTQGIILRETITKLKRIFKDYLPFNQHEHDAYAIEDMNTIWWIKIVEPDWEPKSAYEALRIDYPKHTREQLKPIVNEVIDNAIEEAIKLLGIPRYVIEL